jgi:hypothetical protein
MVKQRAGRMLQHRAGGEPNALHAMPTHRRQKRIDLGRPAVGKESHSTATMTCVICATVKGRRVCQLKDRSLFCPLCCASIRNPDCDGCSYWSQALTYAQQKAAALPARREPPFIARIDPEIDAEVDRHAAGCGDGVAAGTSLSNATGSLVA